MGRALLILLFCPILALQVFGIGNAGERGGLIGADDPAGKRYVYKHNVGEPRKGGFFPQISNRCAVVQTIYRRGRAKKIRASSTWLKRRGAKKSVAPVFPLLSIKKNMIEKRKLR